MLKFIILVKKYIIPFFLLLLAMINNENAFAQASKPKDYSKIQVKALNNAMSLRDFAKCDVAFGMQDSVEKGYVSKESASKWFDFIRVIVLESEQSKNFSSADFFLAKEWYEVGGDPKHFKDLAGIVSTCARTLEPFLETNKLYNDIFVNRSYDYLQGFRVVAKKSGVNLSYVDIAHCRNILSEAASRLRKENQKSSVALENGVRFEEISHYVANVLRWRLIDELKYTRVQLSLAERILGDRNIDYSNADLPAEIKKCVEAVRGAAAKELSAMLSSQSSNDAVRTVTKVFLKEKCILSQSIKSDLLNNDGSVRAVLTAETDIYFSKVDRISYADTADLRKYIEDSDAIVRNLAKKAPRAIFLFGDRDITNTNSSFRSSLYKIADSDVVNKRGRFQYFVFENSDKSSEVYPLLQILALSCQI